MAKRSVNQETEEGSKPSPLLFNRTIDDLRNLDVIARDDNVVACCSVKINSYLLATAKLLVAVLATLFAVIFAVLIVLQLLGLSEDLWWISVAIGFLVAMLALWKWRKKLPTADYHLMTLNGKGLCVFDTDETGAYRGIYAVFKREDVAGVEILSMHDLPPHRAPVYSQFHFFEITLMVNSKKQRYRVSENILGYWQSERVMEIEEKIRSYFNMEPSTQH